MPGSSDSLASFRLRRTLAALACAGAALAWTTPAQADIYGYIDAQGVAHFAAEKVDERYQVMFKKGQRFDTAKGLGRGRFGTAPSLGATKTANTPKTRALIALLERAPSYRTANTALRQAARRHNIDHELLQALVATESGFNTQAISPKGAVGLMQLMPATAQRYGVRADAERSLQAKLHDPHINIGAGARYLRDLIAMFDGSLELALAAYNAGEGAVQRAGNRIPNYRETQNYVQTVMQLYAHLKPGAAPNTLRAAAPGSLRTGAGAGGRVPPRVRMEMPAVQAADAAPSPALPKAVPAGAKRPASSLDVAADEPRA